MAHDSEINQKEFLRFKKEADINLSYQIESLKTDISNIKKDLQEIKKFIDYFIKSHIDQK